MPDVTKRILTDETGQDIVDALEALTNVVDPNGTTVAAATKLNNMTTSITVLPAGSTPTSSLTEVSGHFHLTLGILFVSVIQLYLLLLLPIMEKS